MSNLPKSSEVGLTVMSDLVGTCKRRGLIFPSSEIYGGLAGCWDYGPYGVELKQNLRSSWWKAMTYRDDVVGLDSSILMNANVWKASGHIDHFSDPMVDCKKCKFRWYPELVDVKNKSVYYLTCKSCRIKNSFAVTKHRSLKI